MITIIVNIIRNTLLLIIMIIIIHLREFACLTTVILAPLRMEWGLHAGSATSLPGMPVVPVVPLVPEASYRSMVFFEV